MFSCKQTISLKISLKAVLHGHSQERVAMALLTALRKINTTFDLIARRAVMTGVFFSIQTGLIEALSKTAVLSLCHGGRILRRCTNFLLSYSYTSTWYFWGFVRQPSWAEAACYEWVHWLQLWWPANSVKTGFARSNLLRGSLIIVSSLPAALMAHQ